MTLGSSLQIGFIYFYEKLELQYLQEFLNLRIYLIRKLLCFTNSACGMSPNFCTKENASSDSSGECVNLKDNLLKIPYWKFHIFCYILCNIVLGSKPFLPTKKLLLYISVFFFFLLYTVLLRLRGLQHRGPQSMLPMLQSQAYQGMPYETLQ